jgi:hypothetical protein
MAYCQNQVRKLYDLRRDRRVGIPGRAAAPGRDEKKSRAIAAIDEFLARGGVPPDLEAIARRAREAMAAEAPDEEALERLDEEAEKALAGDSAGLDRTRRIKMQREKTRLPYFAFYYY